MLSCVHGFDLLLFIVEHLLWNIFAVEWLDTVIEHAEFAVSQQLTSVLGQASQKENAFSKVSLGLVLLAVNNYARLPRKFN